MKKEQIKQLALDNGFKLKEQPNGAMDLNPYVYDFALALLERQNVTLFSLINKAMQTSHFHDGRKRKAKKEAYDECLDIIQANQTALVSKEG